MTDRAAELVGFHRSEDAARRLRARYGSERRFQLYGMLAVATASLITVLLVGNMIWQGRLAFHNHTANLEIFFDPQVIDPSGGRDLATLGQANYAALSRKALTEVLPGISTARRDQQQLAGLVTNGVRFQLRDIVLADPSVIGETRTVPVLFSDDADLYFKGQVTDLTVVPTRGVAGVVPAEDEVTIFTGANDFAPILAEVKMQLAARALKTEQALAVEQRKLEAYAVRLEQLRLSQQRAREQGDAADVERLTAELTDLDRQIESARSEVETLGQRAESLKARASAVNAPEELTSDVHSYFVRINGGVVLLTKISAESANGVPVIALQSESEAKPGEWQLVSIDTLSGERRLSDKEIIMLDQLEQKGLVSNALNPNFFSKGDSREPELAGVWGAAVGSFYALVTTLILSFPIGVAAAIYLEEFAPKNKYTDFIEVNINNLAAVPSIVFGLLGLAIFLNFFGLPRSAPFVGGMVLALMSLPTIIIASRAALKAVPPSIREAALGVGASKLQAIFHHVLPLAMPGILTGTIIAMAQALGETAPLLMIGMVAFVVDVPQGFFDAATALPVQIYIWADSPERAFVIKTAGAILVLLGFLVLMNAFAVILRKQFERRW